MTAPKLQNPKSLTAVKGFQITPVIFNNTGDTVLQCEINPALPAGLVLSIENNTCVISGTPMRTAARTVYEVTAFHDKKSSTATIEITVIEAPIKSQREAIISENDIRGDLDTPRSQVENAMGDQFGMNNSIKPHEKFMQQPMGDDKRLSQQTQNNENAENRAQQQPELTPSPSAKLQAQAVNAARPSITPSAKPGG